MTQSHLTALRLLAADEWNIAREDREAVQAILAEREAGKRLTYLACPYSHPDPTVREERFMAVNRAAGGLMAGGKLIFSPISHTHPIAVECDLPKGWDFWHAYDRAFIMASERMIVLTLDGWKESVGVQAEIKIAEELGIPVEYMGERHVEDGR